MMPEIKVDIGGRSFEVACQPGEEAFLTSAAAMLDEEAQVLSDQIGRVPEARMLLMAGLMLADKTAATEDRVRELEAHIATRDTKIAAQQAEITALIDTPPPPPERIEVPVVPDTVTDTLADLAAQAEAIADAVEEKLR